MDERFDGVTVLRVGDAVEFDQNDIIYNVRRSRPMRVVRFDVSTAVVTARYGLLAWILYQCHRLFRVKIGRVWA